MLKGQAKTDYQRGYMREYQRQRRGSKQGLNTGSKQDHLRQVIKNIDNKLQESVTKIPLYDPMIHKPGDRVTVLKGKRQVEIIIPQLDDDGNPMPELS